LVAESVRVAARSLKLEGSGSQEGELVSYNAKRIIALVVILLASTLGGLLTNSFFGSRVAPVLGVVVGAVVGMVLVVIWASRSS
jgi:hypothetical protein